MNFHLKTELKTIPDRQTKPENATVNAHSRWRGRVECSTQKPTGPDSTPRRTRKDAEKYRGGLTYWARTNAIDALTRKRKARKVDSRTWQNLAGQAHFMYFASAALTSKPSWTIPHSTLTIFAGLLC